MSMCCSGPMNLLVSMERQRASGGRGLKSLHCYKLLGSLHFPTSHRTQYYPQRVQLRVPIWNEGPKKHIWYGFRTLNFILALELDPLGNTIPARRGTKKSQTMLQ